MVVLGRIGQPVRWAAVLPIALVSVTVSCGGSAAPSTNGAATAATSGDQSAAVAAGIRPQLPNDFKTQTTFGDSPTVGTVTVNTVTCTETGTSQTYACQGNLTFEGPTYVQVQIVATANNDGSYTSTIRGVDQVLSP